MQIDKIPIKFVIPCEDCNEPVTSFIYKITNITMEFGKRPKETVKRICNSCCMKQYPQHKETIDNQIGMFDE